MSGALTWGIIAPVTHIAATALYETRPWGTYHVLDEGPDYKVKTITVLPGQRLSLQRHQRRAEHWFVVRGQAIVTIDGDVHQLAVGQSIDIPQRAVHRIENPGSANLTFIEVQRGSYLGEDDIERVSDDYGRA